MIELIEFEVITVESLKNHHLWYCIQQEALRKLRLQYDRRLYAMFVVINNFTKVFI